MISLLRKEGLHGRNSPICTLSQNGYGDQVGDIAQYGAQQTEGDAHLSQEKKPGIAIFAFSKYIRAPACGSLAFLLSGSVDLHVGARSV